MKLLNKHSGILGITRSGKSYFFTNHLFNKPNIYAIMFDIKLDDTIEECAKAPLIYNYKKINFKESNKWVIRRRSDQNKDEFHKDVFELIESLFDSNAIIYFFIDEIGRYCSKHKIHDSLEKIMTMGEGKNKYLIWNTQRPQKTHNDIITQTNDFYTFRISENDYKWLVDFGYVPGFRYYGWIQKDYHFIYYDGRDYNLMKPI